MWYFYTNNEYIILDILTEGEQNRQRMWRQMGRQKYIQNLFLNKYGGHSTLSLFCSFSIRFLSDTSRSI